jgi:Holliday junction resolvase
MARRAAKVDANQRDIVSALRFAGASVSSLAMVGDGCPDLLVGFEGVTWLMEVKDGSKTPSRRRLGTSQVEFIAAWRGKPIRVVESPSDALLAILDLRRRDEVLRMWQAATLGTDRGPKNVADS